MNIIYQMQIYTLLTESGVGWPEEHPENENHKETRGSECEEGKEGENGKKSLKDIESAHIF